MNSFGLIAHILDSLMDCNNIDFHQAEALVNSLVEDDELWQPVDDYLNNKLKSLKGGEDNA